MISVVQYEWQDRHNLEMRSAFNLLRSIKQPETYHSVDEAILGRGMGQQKLRLSLRGATYGKSGCAHSRENEQPRRPEP